MHERERNKSVMEKKNKTIKQKKKQKEIMKLNNNKIKRKKPIHKQEKKGKQ